MYLPEYFLLILLTGSLTYCIPKNVHIAYTSNLNGTLESCNCNKDDLGGIVRLAQAIDSLKTHYPSFILLDSGDFLNSFSFPELNALTWELMSDLQYDAIGVGDQEFVEGQKWLEQLYRKYPLPLVNSNILVTDGQINFFQEIMILERNNLRIGILSAILPDCFSFIKEVTMKSNLVEIEIFRLLDHLHNKTDLNVLLLHGSFEAGVRLAQKYPEIQIVISGHTQEKRVQLLKNQIVIQAGFDGEYLGFLDIDSSNARVNIRNHFIPVHRGYQENLRLREKLENYYQSFRK